MKYGVMRLFGCLAISLCTALILPAHGSEPSKNTWHFGEGLDLGDEFVFDVCDPVLRIPEVPDHCYTITMRFLALLPTHDGMVWIVASHIDYKTGDVDMIFQISARSFKIRTDGTNTAYADSVERTIGWIRQFSNENRPQTLSVGKSWGMVPGDMNWPTQITVNRIDYDGFEKTDSRYLLGYSFIKESQIQIMDGFPFPLKATIYKPVSSHQNPPLEFSFQMSSYQNSDNNTCHYVTPLKNPDSRSLMHQNNNQSSNDLLLSNSDDIQNSTDVEEFTVDEMLRHSNDNSTVQELLKNAYGSSYGEKMRQSIYNFTRFIEMISQASNAILESQLNQTNASLPN
jgi:hypothetical protein